MDEQLAATVAQIRARPDFEQQVLLFLASLPYIYENKDLIVVHAAYKQLARVRRRRVSLFMARLQARKVLTVFRSVLMPGNRPTWVARPLSTVMFR